MDHETLLVLGRPGEPLLARLEASIAEMHLVVAATPEAFERAAPSATIILCLGRARATYCARCS